MKTLKIIILLFMIGWPMVILIGGIFSFSGEVANNLSLGLLKKLMVPGFEELGALVFFCMFFIGLVITITISEKK